MTGGYVAILNTATHGAFLAPSPLVLYSQVETMYLRPKPKTKQSQKLKVHVNAPLPIALRQKDLNN